MNAILIDFHLSSRETELKLVDSHENPVKNEKRLPSNSNNESPDVMVENDLYEASVDMVDNDLYNC